MMRNAPEMEFLLEITIDLIRKLIPKGSEVKFDCEDVEAMSPEQQKIKRMMNLGILADYLRNNHVNVKTDETSGVEESKVAKLAMWNLMRQYTVNTPFDTEVVQKALGTLGMNVPRGQLQPQPQMPQGQAPQMPEQMI